MCPLSILVTGVSKMKRVSRFLGLIISVPLMILNVSSAHAQEATLSGNIIAIPVVEVGDSYYSIELTIITDVSTIDLAVTAAAELDNPNNEGASIFGLSTNELCVPSINVDGDYYWARFLLISESPAIFRLTGAELVNSQAQESCDSSAIGWWQQAQVWAAPPGNNWDDASVIGSFDFPAYDAMNVSVISWFEGSRVAIDELHSRGFSIVGYNGMLGMFQPDRTNPELFWDESAGIYDFTMDEPEELAPAIMIDPFGNLTYSHIFGFSEEVQFLQYSVPHPLYQEHMTQHMKNLIDVGVDGYLIDELAYGSVDLPDFNPHTLEEFKRFLEAEFEPSDLQALLDSVGVADLVSFDYAAVVREQLPADATALSIEDWNANLPLFALFRRFLALQNLDAATALIENGRQYAAETKGKVIPFSSNVNNLAAPDNFLIVPLLDMIDLEFFYLDFGYFRNGRGIAPLKLTRYFDKPAMLRTSISAHEDLVAWGAAGTIDIYGTMIADAVSSGGEFHVDLGVGPMDGPIEQDINALAPYYRFRTDHPGLFDNLEPLESQIAVLHLWENVLTDPYWTRAYFGISSLLADSGVQFDAVFGAKEYLSEGELPMYPAPDFPLDIELLRTYPVLVIPELNDLIETHASTLLDYIDGGGVVVAYAEDDIGLEIQREADPSVVSFLQLLRSGAENAAGGKVVRLDENLARNYNNDPDPTLRQEWLNVIGNLGLNPEVRYDAGPMLAAQVYAADNQLVVHFVNYNWDRQALSTAPLVNIGVEIALPAGFNREGLTASAHAPGEAAVELDVEPSAAGIIVTIPELHIWSVISIDAGDGDG